MTEVSNEYDRDWELMAKRLIALNDLGFHISQSDGHRWLIYHGEREDLRKIRDKHYGSYRAVLDYVDTCLISIKEKSLIERFGQNINYYDDLSNVFGDGVQ